MQTGQRIWKECVDCSGTGIQYMYQGTINNAPSGYPEAPGEEVACPKCDGLGVRTWGWLRDDKEDTMPGEGI